MHEDERSSIVAVTNASGVAVSTNSYDDYGQPATTNLGRFQYTGQAWVPEFGSYYYRARQYHPTLGRFLQPDPIGYGGGINLYAYVNGDPINLTDPLGLDTCVNGEEEEICVYGKQNPSPFMGPGRPTLALLERNIPLGGETGASSDQCQRRSRWGGSFGLWGGASAEAGVISAGAAYQKQFSAMGFSNGENAVFDTHGGFVGGPGWGESTPSTVSKFSNSDGGVVAGLALGVGGGITYSNATNPSDLSGAAKTWNVNVGVLGGSVSSGENGIFSINLGVAKGWGLDLSYYTTDTKIHYRSGC